ncbi:MAG: UDP-N-acetylmuramoyl-tripeptide-D-alanyl-D-alanine ligase [Parcubacteria group bacterium GW2011_GWA2_43_11]|nr:MAG: UDP-N-acetylmuramoyl-tripeptide-D-alanyl-D-alanine ligase [Parcubacteria group bacterium GW2011_GWC2_42_11]KKS86265.1 MAG: UDP-N-acetylmuramoyl-tripeptide-D-alanyl-D-alanine ligase [Parcubacteria group bacterium GW2011_GWA2_43_11]
MKETIKKGIVAILIWEAKRVVRKFKPKIITVTGSVGKTGTKDAVYTILSQTEHARKSEKSFNSEIGVPLTVLGLPNAWSSMMGWIENIGEGFILPWRHNAYPDWLVLEIGVDRPGDIQRLSWLNSDVVIFTQFPDVPVHVEYFASPEDVRKEKCKLKDTLKPEGTLIINADDSKMSSEEVREGQHRLSYGFSEHATVRGYDYMIMYEEGKPVGISFTAQFQEKKAQVNLDGVLGRHHVYPLLAALTVIISEGKAFEKSALDLSNHILAPGRMRLLQGMKGSTIVDDTYNSSPVAVRAGLEALTTLQVKGKKIVVLGDMLELGDFSVQEHKMIGELVATEADVFVAVGVRMLGAAELVQATKARCTSVMAFKTSEEAIKTLQEIIAEDDVVFVKGSQGMRMERIVENIMLESPSAINLLVRQDSHWKNIK